MLACALDCAYVTLSIPGNEPFTQLVTKLEVCTIGPILIAIGGGEEWDCVPGLRKILGGCSRVWHILVT